MKIYYLNSDKKPVGPHTKEEIISLKQAGVIDVKTLAAKAGDSKWRPLSEVLPDCSTWNKEENSMGQSDSLTEELSLWACFVRALKQYAVFKGRATRKEFWSFYLFYVIFEYAVKLLGELFTQGCTQSYEEKLETISEHADLSELVKIFVDYFQEPAVIISFSISTLYGLFMLVPFLSVSVRRLHDRGISALPVIIACISDVVLLGSFAYLLVAFIQNIDHCETFFASMQPSVLAMMISLIFALIFGIYLLIQVLLPSKQGENKYGPQPRN